MSLDVSYPPALVAPRTSARAQLLNAFSDLVFPREEPVATSTMLRVMSDAGFEVVASRKALARAAASGWIVPERRGRETWWTISRHGRELIRDGYRRVETLGRDVPAWNGEWVVLFLSVPQHQRTVRPRLERYLTWSSFGSPAAGLWVSPFLDREHGAQFAVDHFELAEHALSFVGRSGSIGLDDREIVHRAWSLSSLEAHYATLLARHRAVRPQSGPAAVRALFDLNLDIQQLPFLDPQLPAELYDGARSRHGARALLELKAQWRARARDHVSDLEHPRS